MRSSVTSRKERRQSRCAAPAEDPLGDAQSRSTSTPSFLAQASLLGSRPATATRRTAGGHSPSAGEVHDVDRAPVGERRDRRVGDLLEDALVVERLGQQSAGLRRENRRGRESSPMAPAEARVSPARVGECRTKRCSSRRTEPSAGCIRCLVVWLNSTTAQRLRPIGATRAL